MRTPLAWRNLAHNPLRSAAVVGGVSLAILLIFMQLGFRAAAASSATSVQDALDFDVLVVSPDYLFLAQPASFPRERLEELRSVPGVTDVAALWVDLGEWRNITTRERWNVLSLGIDPAAPPFRDPMLDAASASLSVPDTALADTRARPVLGPMVPGTASEVEHHRIRLVDSHTIGAGFTANATLVTGRETFFKMFPARASLDRPNLGLVRIVEGESADAVAAEINRRLAPAAKALTRAESDRAERRFWLGVRPIGIMFSSGVLIAFAAGAVILYQVVASQVQNRIGEYATLKALGYGDNAIYRTVVQQAVFYSLLAFMPAFVLALVLYGLLRSQALVPVAMEPARAAAVLLLTLAMGSSAAFLALLKLRRADPADIF
jgi:putative ABC transport system permease protein